LHHPLHDLPIRGCRFHFRTSFNNGLKSDIAPCRFWANSRLANGLHRPLIAYVGSPSRVRGGFVFFATGAGRQMRPYLTLGSPKVRGIGFWLHSPSINLMQCSCCPKAQVHGRVFLLSFGILASRCGCAGTVVALTGQWLRNVSLSTIRANRRSTLKEMAPSPLWVLVVQTDRSDAAVVANHRRRPTLSRRIVQ
jgi:hypothetical protein